MAHPTRQAHNPPWFEQVHVDGHCRVRPDVPARNLSGFRFMNTCVRFLSGSLPPCRCLRLATLKVKRRACRLALPRENATPQLFDSNASLFKERHAWNRLRTSQCENCARALLSDMWVWESATLSFGACTRTRTDEQLAALFVCNVIVLRLTCSTQESATI